MRELSLFTGAGGGLLGTKLLGWHHIGYVEFNEYCQKVIRQRIEDGFIDRAPIFTDVREFLQSGAAEQYRGFADVVTAGFPCQPFSVAGKQKGAEDERDMWPTTIDIIRAVKPRFCLLENVPGLLSVCDESAGHFRYIQQVFRDLAEAGYDARWCVLGADDCGAPHIRKRLWILAYSSSERLERHWKKYKLSKTCKKRKASRSGENLPDTECFRSSRSWWAQEPIDTTEKKNRKEHRAFDGSRWGIESPVGRVADGVANRVDKLKSIGNGQVPAVVAAAWRLLSA